MKKLILLAIFALTVSTTYAQRFAIVDVNSILTKMDDYSTAQKSLDKISSTWRQEISEQYDEIKSLYNKYQAEQVLLSDEERTTREEEIMAKEQEVRKLQKQRFGPEGDLFRRRKELVQPIQEKVSQAIHDYAKERGYDVIFDKSSEVGILFASDEIDKTSMILRKLGLKTK